MSARYTRALAFVALLAASVSLGSMATKAAELSPALKALAAAADKEGTLTVVAGDLVLGGADNWKTLETGMNAMFGTNIKIRWSPGPALMQQGFQVIQEYKAGRKSSSDLYDAPNQIVLQMLDADMLTRTNWKELLPGRVTDEMTEEGGALLRWQSYARGVIYNTKLLPNPPRTLTGYLDPSLKGKLATTPYAAGFDLLAAPDSLGPEGTIKYAKQLTEQVSGLIRCPDEDRIISGEFSALLIDCGEGNVPKEAAQGAPIGRVLLKEMNRITFFYWTVPKNAEHPNAAKLAAAYFMTEEGQKLAQDAGGRDLMFFPDSHVRQSLKDLSPDLSGLTYVSADWMRHTDVGKTLEAVVNIFAAKK
jgi:iron(III) transport system substrate-binding protein